MYIVAIAMFIYTMKYIKSGYAEWDLNDGSIEFWEQYSPVKYWILIGVHIVLTVAIFIVVISETVKYIFRK
jgi:hypothetical protein